MVSAIIISHFNRSQPILILIMLPHRAFIYLVRPAPTHLQHTFELRLRSIFCFNRKTRFMTDGLFRIIFETVAGGIGINND